MDGQTELAICNIPIAFFLKKRGDKYIFMLYHTNNHKQNVLVNALQKFQLLSELSSKTMLVNCLISELSCSRAQVMYIPISIYLFLLA